MQPKPLEIVTSSTPSKTTKTRRTTRQWQDLMQAYEDGGLSQQTFCQRHGIALSTFYAWRNKLKTQSGPDNERSAE